MGLEDIEYPIDELNKFVGKLLEVHYSDLGNSRIYKKILVHPSNNEFFNIGNPQKHSHHIVYWDRTDRGVRSAVRLIIAGNQEIYRNDSVDFDYSSAEEYQETTSNP